MSTRASSGPGPGEAELPHAAALPLAAMRVLITRAAEDQGPLAELVRARGGVPVSLPCIAFAGPADRAALDAELDALVAAPPDALLFASPQAVRRFCAELRGRGHDPSLFAHPGTSSAAPGGGGRAVILGAAGAGTRAALDQLGLPGAVIPEQGVGAEALAKKLGPSLAGRRVVVPHAEGGSPLLEELLARAGATVRSFVLYRTLPIDPAVVARDPALAIALELVHSGGCPAILLASGSAARGFAALFGPDAARISAGSTVVCMGEPSASEARKSGLTVAAVASGGLSELVEALVQALVRGAGAGPGPPAG